jgi:L-threonylcarbamoyladenylate synthase
MSEQILIAVEKLKKGEVVAIPTETVYGLAAVISNPEAIAKIFSTKQRPFFDPLIVHVNCVEQAKQVSAVWSEAIEILTNEFWPGPLTLVLPKKNISDIITSGLPTVGIRCPAHKTALEIITKVGEPLAAPSANRFGKTSPTSADHVVEEFNGAVFVVDGGLCSVGIESTIISVEESDRKVDISILRAGIISPTQIAKALDKLKKDVIFNKASNKILAPGQVKHHYMPKIPILWVSREIIDDNKGIGSILKLIPDSKFLIPMELRLNSDPTIAARELYSQMRICSAPPTDLIVCVKESYQIGEKWDSILDRINRASSFKIF